MYKCQRCGRELTAHNMVIGWTDSVYCKYCKIPIMDIDEVKDKELLNSIPKIGLAEMREEGYLI